MPQQFDIGQYIWPDAGQDRQPQGTKDPSEALPAPFFIYDGLSSSFLGARTIAGGANPTKVVAPVGIASGFSGSNYQELPNSNVLFDRGFSFVMVARFNASAGVQAVFARNRGGIPGGIEAALYNNFGIGPAVYVHYHNGSANVGPDACFVDGLGPFSGNGAPGTVQGKWYTVACRLDYVPANNQGQNFLIAKIFDFGNDFTGTVDVALVAAYATRLSNGQLQALSANPRRMVFGTPTLGLPAAAAGGTLYTQTLTATVGSSATLTKQAGASRAGSSLAAPTLAKVAQPTRAAATAPTATVAKRAQAPKAASTTLTAVMTKQAQATKAASTALAVTLGQIKVKLLTLTASIAMVASVVKQVKPVRLAATTLATTLVKQMQAIKAASTTPTPSVVKTMSATKAAATAGVAALATIKAKLLTLTAAVVLSASIIKQAQVIKPASTTVAATIAKSVRKVLIAPVVNLVTIAIVGGSSSIHASAGYIVAATGRAWQAASKGRVWKIVGSVADRIVKWGK